MRAAAAAALLLLLPACGGTAAGVPGPPPLHGHSAQYVTMREPYPVPPMTFRAAVGAPGELAALRGRTVLLNFWASWCAPCVREMPALDRLAARADFEGLVVLPVSLDEDLPTVAAFYARHGLTHLPQVLAAAAAAAGEKDVAGLPLYGLPITYVIDTAGRVRGYLVGAADWDSEAALRLLRHYD